MLWQILNWAKSGFVHQKNGDAFYFCLQLYTSTISRLPLPAKHICPCGKGPTRGKVTGGGSFIWEKSGGEEQWWKRWPRNGKRLYKACKLCERCYLEVLVVHPWSRSPQPKSGQSTPPAVLAIPHVPDLLLQLGGPGLGCLSPAGQHLDGTDQASWYHPVSALSRSICTSIHHLLTESLLQCLKARELHLNEDCILEHARVKFASCGSTVKAKSGPPRLETDWKLEWNQLLCAIAQPKRGVAGTLNQLRKDEIPYEWHRSYHCSWIKGLPSHQRVWPWWWRSHKSSVLLRPPCSHCPTEGRRQGRDLALLLHHHVPRRTPDDRYGPVTAYVLPGGVTVSLLYFWPIINFQSNSR